MACLTRLVAAASIAAVAAGGAAGCAAPTRGDGTAARAASTPAASPADAGAEGLADAALAAMRGAPDAARGIERVRELAAGSSNDRRRAAALRLERQAGGWPEGDGPRAGGAAATRLPALPGWLALLPTDREAVARAADARAGRDLEVLLASVTPPPGDEGPRPRPRRADPADRQAAAERLEQAREARASGRLLRAVSDLRLAAGLDPSSIDIHRELARTAELIGNLELAAESWRAVASVRPSDAEAAIALAVEALEAGRPLQALSLLRPALPEAGLESDAEGTAAARRPPGGLPSPAAPEDEGGSTGPAIFGRPLQLALLRACEALGADAAIASVAESLLPAAGRSAGAPGDASSSAETAGRSIASLRGLERGDAEIALAAGDAHLRRGRWADARLAYVRAEAAATEHGGSADVAASVLLRRAWLELAVGDTAAAFAAVRRTAARWPASDAAARVAEVVAGDAEPGDERGSAVLAAVALRLEPRDPRLPAAPSDRMPGVADRLLASGPSWPHPLPEVRAAALRSLRARTRPLGLDEASVAGGPPPTGDPAAVAALAFEACGWLGPAWDVLEAAASDPARATPRVHVARVRLAGLLRDRAALRTAIVGAAAAGLRPVALDAAGDLESVGDAVDARDLPGADDAPHDSSPAPGPPAAERAAWRAVLGVAAVTALARVERIDDAVAVAEALRDEVARAGDAVGRGPVPAAVELVLAAARAERAWTAPPGPGRRDDVREAIAVAAAVLGRRPADAVAWELLDRMLAPTGPVDDPAARVRHRRQWAVAAAGTPVGAALERDRRLRAGGHEMVDDAARLRLLVDAGDEAAIEDLLASRQRDGRPDAAVAWLEGRLARHPADPVAATALMRVEAMAGRPDAAWARLEARLDRDRDDLVALRLAETAAGLAGDAMMRLVMAERRLLARPASPHREVLLARLAIAAGQTRDALQSVAAFVDGIDVAADGDVLAASAVLRQASAGDGDGDPAAAPEASATLGPAERLELRMADALVARGRFPVEPVVRGLAARLRRDGPDAAVLAAVDALAAAAPDALAASGVARPVDPWRTLAADLAGRGMPDRAAVVVARRLLRGSETGTDLEEFVALHVALEAATAAALEEAAGVTPVEAPLHALLGPAVVREAAGLGGGSESPDSRESRATEAPAAPTAVAAPPAPGTLVGDLLARLAEDGRLAPGAGANGAAAAGAAAASGDRPLADALARASQVHRLVGATAAADALLERALAVAPDDPAILNDLGYTRLEAARRVDPRAARMIERAHRLDPGSAAVTDSLGWLRYRQGRLDDGPDGEPGALTLLERAAELSAGTAEGPGGEVLLHLGDARWRAGDRDGAIDAWRRGSMLDGSEGHRSDTERRLRNLQDGVWGVLVRDPARMYDSLFGSTARALRARLEALGPGGAGRPPVRPTDAEVEAGDDPGSGPSRRGG